MKRRNFLRSLLVAPSALLLKTPEVDADPIDIIKDLTGKDVSNVCWDIGKEGEDCTVVELWIHCSAGDRCLIQRHMFIDQQILSMSDWLRIDRQLFKDQTGLMDEGYTMERWRGDHREFQMKSGTHVKVPQKEYRLTRITEGF